ncbi:MULTISPECIES: hypothetical protein [Bacillus cereus group]|uniref:hypothetical protein n=1 Tax=Bacillus cereus group TaxID=86661 RepID=UPI00077AB5DC|nr:hypothetical protein [Bacillus cereus]KAB2456596.1 hypothetical protein F8161_24095 [Bacillus cereus]KXY96299.1 hypothetical protein AT279_08455 [Bacillus cereus]MCU5351523.1 hypothetical protein [Bacillus cereus]MDK7410781.1 hypothetical protein [Bacillus cereus]MDK7416317.1 hypothetical protein [Bacillus cereus]
MIKKVRELLEDTVTGISKMNKEYENMEADNKIRSSEIRSSINLKSNAFQTRKKKTDKMFEFIRNK